MNFRPFKSFFIRVTSCLFLLTAVAHAQGLAMAVDRTGDVEVAAGGKSARLNVLDYLPPDAEVRLASGASATLVYLATSQEWQFSGPGRYRLQADKPVVLQGSVPKANGVPAPSAQAMAKLEPTQRQRMALGALVMRGIGSLRIVSPNNVDVLATRPTLLWNLTEPLPVRISVFGQPSPSVPVAQTVTTAMQWTLPTALPAGDYTWRADIISETSSGSRSGRFRVIDSSDGRRARIAPMAEGFSQRVAYAVMLETEDLPHDALLVWRSLAAERPEEESLKQWAR